jgi:hypothetical protein
MVCLTNDADAWCLPPRGYAIAGGPARANGVGHAVVVQDGKLVHDPHEGWDGLREIEDYTIIYSQEVVQREP